MAQRLAERVRPYLLLSTGTFASDSTAARLLGVPLPKELEDEARLHLSSSSKTGPRRKHVVGHSRTFDPEEVTLLDGLPVTSPARTWLDLASVLCLEDLIVAGDFLVCTHEDRGFARSRPPLISLEELDLYISRKRRVPGLAMARKALPFLRVGVDSPQETRLRLMLQAAQHLPPFRVDYPVSPDDYEFPRWVDLACPEFRTCVEYEGAHHLTPLQQVADKGRDSFMVDCGWNQVKIYAKDLELGAEWVIPQVEAALRRGGWRMPS
jgi:very-short-patch-repair endonuclease